ncbi:DUF1302 family protein [Treponema primitia]|uniref:DUF1302 family protein n=1 Tax=Treponema primitia TaxID=88058 RepID=UPI00025550AE|nr:DUF1302 family protein [Treponema primitia]
MKRFLFSLLVLSLVLLPGKWYLRSDDDFGFGGDTGSGSDTFSNDGDGFGFGGGVSSAPSPQASALSSVKIGGEVSAALLGFTDDFETADKIKQGQLGDVFSGALNFSVSGSAADAVINLNLTPSASPLTIDEAYVRAYFGPVNIEGGIRKLSWGRADSFGPLDVVNPLDYTDLTKISDPMSLKIGLPLAHVSWGIGNFSKLEGVFIPGFQGHRFAMEGRWVPSQITDLQEQGIDLENHYQTDTASLQYAQAGLRFTTTVGSSDFGVQYYYGRLPRPALDIKLDRYFINHDPNDVLSIDYNDYHQIGIDFARVIADFNVRAEAAANITGDLDGDRGDVYNPSVAWSLGFDRDIGGVNVNLQVTENILLFQDKIGKDPMVIDTEDGKDVTATRLTLILSKKLFRDKLEIKAVGLWDMEDKACLIMPTIAWTQNDVSIALSGGIFGGIFGFSDDGELGQYRDNHFVKAVLTYSF